MSISDFRVRVTNITTSFNLNRSLDFDTLREKFGGRLKEAKSHFSRLTWRLHQFGNTGMIYKSGKIVIVGSRSHLAAEEAAHYLFDHLEGDGPLEIKHSNIAGTTDFKHFVYLKSFFEYLQMVNGERHFGEYETETFPALFYLCKKNTPTASQVKATIFRSGKVIYSGAKKLDELIEANIELYNLLRAFQDYSLFELSFDDIDSNNEPSIHSVNSNQLSQPIQ